jgi:hypothetical protein
VTSRQQPGCVNRFYPIDFGERFIVVAHAGASIRSRSLCQPQVALCVCLLQVKLGWLY